MPKSPIKAATAVLASLVLLSTATTGLASDPAGSTRTFPPRPDAPTPAALPTPSNGGPTGLAGAQPTPPPEPIDDFQALDPDAGQDAQIDALVGTLPPGPNPGLDLDLAANTGGQTFASVAYCYPDSGVGCGPNGLTGFEENCKGGLASGENESGPYVSCTLPPHD